MRATSPQSLPEGKFTLVEGTLVNMILESTNLYNNTALDMEPNLEGKIYDVKYLGIKEPKLVFI